MFFKKKQAWSQEERKQIVDLLLELEKQTANISGKYNQFKTLSQEQGYDWSQMPVLVVRKLAVDYSDTLLFLRKEIHWDLLPQNKKLGEARKSFEEYWTGFYTYLLALQNILERQKYEDAQKLWISFVMVEGEQLKNKLKYAILSPREFYKINQLHE